MGRYERDARLTNARPSYTKHDGSAALWYSATKADGSPNHYWHVAGVEHRGGACGYLGAYDPDGLVAEGIAGPWQAGEQACTYVYMPVCMPVCTYMDVRMHACVSRRASRDHGKQPAVLMARWLLTS